MATIQALTSRLRLELADARSPFTSRVEGDGQTRRYELPHSPVEPTGFTVFTSTSSATVALTPGTDYVLDSANGVVLLTYPLPIGTTMFSRGDAARFFSDADLAVFLTTAVAQHTHGSGTTMGTLPPVEEYLVVLLATVEALYALMNDAAFDIDVNTPEGVSVPRSQRFRQLMQMVELRKGQYAELAQALNVGINRIEMFTLRRVSRSTGRLVPIYKPREIEDTRPPQRVYAPIDSLGDTEVPDPNEPATLDLFMRQGNTFELPLDFSFDLTGYEVYASIRRYHGSARLREFTIERTDEAAGQITIRLSKHDTRLLPNELFWDLYIRDPQGDERPYLRGRVEVERARLGLTQPYGTV